MPYIIFEEDKHKPSDYYTSVYGIFIMGHERLIMGFIDRLQDIQKVSGSLIPKYSAFHKRKNKYTHLIFILDRNGDTSLNSFAYRRAFQISDELFDYIKLRVL